MTYSLDEQETHIWFDPTTKETLIETNYYPDIHYYLKQVNEGIKQREPSCKQPTNEFAIFKMTYSTSLPLTCIERTISS